MEGTDDFWKEKEKYVDDFRFRSRYFTITLGRRRGPLSRLVSCQRFERLTRTGSKSPRVIEAGVGPPRPVLDPCGREGSGNGCEQVDQMGGGLKRGNSLYRYHPSDHSPDVFLVLLTETKEGILPPRLRILSSRPQS